MPMPGNKQRIVEQMRQPYALSIDKPLTWCNASGIDLWAIICACITGDLPAVQLLLEKDPGLVKGHFEYFKPLHFAVREGHEELVHFLLGKGADPKNPGGDPPATMARDRGYTELAELFDSILQNQFHIVPEAEVIASAIKAYDLPKVQALLKEQPALLHQCDHLGNMPIHWAVLTRQIELIDYLLLLGADINAIRPTDGGRPIDLTNGDYHYRSWYRDLPAHALQKHEILVGYLLAKGAYMDISVAAKMGYLDRVRELLEQDPALANASPNWRGYYSGLPLRNAARGGYYDIVKLLLEKGADVNGPEEGIAPRGHALYAALSNKHARVVKLLLEHGADPNAPVESSGNCMMIAKHGGASQEILDLLASYGGVMGPEFADVETLAAMLSANPQLRVPERLSEEAILRLMLKYQPDYLKAQIDPSAQWDGSTLKSPEHARWLFGHGLDPTRRNWLGFTLLHRCAIHNDTGDPGVAAVCLEYGADIDAVETEWCSTPLGWAARHGRTEMVKWLLQHGADPKLPAEEPWAQPLAWAKRRSHHDIVQLLQ